MRSGIFTLALTGSLMLAPYAFTAQQAGEKQHDQKAYGQQQESTAGQQDRMKQQRENTTGQQKDQYAQRLLTADHLKGMQIHTHQGEEIGSVDQLIFDTKEGKLAYVVVSTGGFWGIGEQTAVVPWNALAIQAQQTQQRGQFARGDMVLVLNVEKEQLKNAPQGDLQTVLDRRQGIEIHRFYGVSPYWEGGQESQVQTSMPPGHQPKEMRGGGEPPGHWPKEERDR